jgi:uncharacterized membrane protein YecN with MAPEG domain
LGIYPSIECVLAQGVFIALLVFATAVSLRRRSVRAGQPESDDIVAELRALRNAVESVRDTLLTVRAAESPQLGTVAARVEGVLVQVERLAGRVGGQREGH